MRKHWFLVVAAALLSSACFDNPTAEYAQRIIGSWRMDDRVAGKPARGVLHIMPDGAYILDNRDSWLDQWNAKVAHKVMREMGVRFNDFGTFQRANRFRLKAAVPA